MLRSVTIDGVPGATARYVTSDIAQSLPAAIVTVAGRTALGALITCEANPVRIGLGGATPTQGASSLGHLLNPGDVYRVAGSQMLSTLKYISASAANAGVLQITPLYTP